MPPANLNLEISRRVHVLQFKFQIQQSVNFILKVQPGDFGVKRQTCYHNRFSAHTPLELTCFLYPGKTPGFFFFPGAKGRHDQYVGMVEGVGVCGWTNFLTWEVLSGVFSPNKIMIHTTTIRPEAWNCQCGKIFGLKVVRTYLQYRLNTKNSIFYITQWGFYLCTVE